jgi:ubiquinone/menaquinone biosynthesis C-methylase UbiE
MENFFQQIESSTGNPVKEIRIDPEEFNEFKARYKAVDSRQDINDQKLLEYFISYRFLGFTSSDVYIDIAAQNCPFVSFIGETFGCKTYRQDLYYMERGIHDGDIGGDASRLPLKAGSVTKLSLHNSFEHFEGNSDVRFIREAQRVLGIGGKMVIVPIFFEDKYQVQEDSGWVDEKGVKHLWGEGARFSRFYNMEYFDKRITRNAGSLNIQFYSIQNIQELGPDCYGQLFIVFEKTKSVGIRDWLVHLLDRLQPIMEKKRPTMKSITQKTLRYFLWQGQRVVNWLRKKLTYARDARAFTRALFEDVDSLDKQEVNETLNKFHEFCTARGIEKNPRGEWDWDTHVYRVMLSEKWIEDILGSLSGKITALDLGGEGVASDYWRYKFPQVQWENTDYDLRYGWKASTSSTDLIVCTELVEHLSDLPNAIFNEGFYKGGFIAMLKECFRVLKPSGYLFITTPNAASVLHLKAVLQGNPPWFFGKHVREYTLPEVVGLLQDVGLEVARKRDIHCLTVMAFSDFSPVFQLLLENGYPVEGRGDDLFILARKPG